MVQKIPFNSTLLTDLRILNPATRTGRNDFLNAVVRVAERFPQLNLTSTLDELRIEAIDLQMADMPDPPTDVDDFWAAVHKIECMESQQPAYSECHSFKPTNELLCLNKSAMRRYNEEHGSYGISNE
jgi:hypothetical protein